MTENCAQDTQHTIWVALILIIVGVFLFNFTQTMLRKFMDWYYANGIPAGQQEKTLLYAIAKHDIKKVRISFQKELPNGQVSSFCCDMEPTAACEFADAVKVSARTVANLELVNDAE